MTAATGYEIRSEARGSHWIAWVSRNGDPKPTVYAVQEWFCPDCEYFEEAGVDDED